MSLNNESESLKTVVNFLIEDVPIEELPLVDAIFVFGHVEPRVAEHAAKLFKLGKAPKLIVTGKGRVPIPGFASEAEFYVSVLEKEGIFKENIISEDKAMNSLENVLYGMEAVKKNKVNVTSLIIVAVPALLKRYKAIFKKQFPRVKIYGSTYGTDLVEWKSHKKRLMGEFERFSNYFKKGDIAEVLVPQNVTDALAVLENQVTKEDTINDFLPHKW